MRIRPCRHARIRRARRAKPRRANGQIDTMLRQFHCRGRCSRRAAGRDARRRRRMRHQGAAAPGAEGSGDATAAADRQPGDTPGNDVAGASSALDRRPTASRERLCTTSTASFTPKTCRCPRSRSDSARRATCIRGRSLTSAYRTFDAAFAGIPHLVCYAMKANPILAILDLFARLGSGFDIVSGGELARVIAAGGDRAQGRVLGRRQERRRDGSRARRGHPVLQRRVRVASSSISPRSPARRARARRSASASIRTSIR